MPEATQPPQKPAKGWSFSSQCTYPLTWGAERETCWPPPLLPCLLLLPKYRGEGRRRLYARRPLIGSLAACRVCQVALSLRRTSENAVWAKFALWSVWTGAKSFVRKQPYGRSSGRAERLSDNDPM